MRIGELERRTGLSRHTIRYYERFGLIDPPCRLDNNYRDYGPDHLARIRFVKALQALGFRLAVIRDHLERHDNRALTCAAVAPVVRDKLDEIDREMARLRETRTALQRFFAACAMEHRDETCQPLADLLR